MYFRQNWVKIVKSCKFKVHLEILPRARATSGGTASIYIRLQQMEKNCFWFYLKCEEKKFTDKLALHVKKNFI